MLAITIIIIVLICIAVILSKDEYYTHSSTSSMNNSSNPKLKPDPLPRHEPNYDWNEGHYLLIGLGMMLMIPIALFIIACSPFLTGIFIFGVLIFAFLGAAFGG